MKLLWLLPPTGVLCALAWSIYQDRKRSQALEPATTATIQALRNLPAAIRKPKATVTKIDRFQARLDQQRRTA